MEDAALIERIRQKFKSLGPVMDERVRRQWAAAEATAIGWGGIAAVVAATGMSHNTINRGGQELRERRKRARQPVRSKRIRRVGGGRKAISQSDPSIAEALERLVEPLTRGDSRIAAAMDVQEHAEVGRGTAKPRARCRGTNRGHVAAPCRLQLAVES